MILFAIYVSVTSYFSEWLCKSKAVWHASFHSTILQYIFLHLAIEVKSKKTNTYFLERSKSRIQMFEEPHAWAASLAAPGISRIKVQFSWYVPTSYVKVYVQI